MRLPALAGTTVAITADRRHDEQAELFERRGARVLHGPTIRTIPVVHDERLHRAIEAVVSDPPDTVVLTTALGLRSWLAAAESLGLGDDLVDALRSCEVLVRGAKAMGAAVTAGIDVAWNAPGATANEIVDRLTADAADAQARGGGPRRLAVQLDGDPDTPLPARLRALGHDVLEVPVYQWTMPLDPGPARRVVAAVAEGTVDAATFTSGPALRNFFAVAEATGTTEAVLDAFDSGRVTAVCVGPVSAAQARALGVAEPVSPQHHRLGAMVQACVSHRAADRHELHLCGHEVVVQGRVVAVGDDAPTELADRERAVLQVLLRRPGVVVAKSALGREVWGPGADDHTTEVTVARLRKRLGAAGPAVETVVRRGYRVQVG